MAHTSEGLAYRSTATDPGDGDFRLVFRSRKISVSAPRSTDVSVDVKLDANDIDLDAMLREIQTMLDRQGGTSPDAASLVKMTRASLRQVIEITLERSLTKEFDAIVAAYRDMLERRMASGEDEAISRALTRVKLQTEVLLSVAMVDQAEACALLGLSDTNPSATLRRYEAKDRILRFNLKGKAAYPLFQFDVAERRIHPVVLILLKMRTEEWGGKIALLHWLTSPNLSLGGAKPYDQLAQNSDTILKSFSAEIAEPLNG